VIRQITVALVIAILVPVISTFKSFESEPDVVHPMPKECIEPFYVGRLTKRYNWDSEIELNEFVCSKRHQVHYCSVFRRVAYQTLFLVAERAIF
jgi:hypothetical protein